MKSVFHAMFGSLLLAMISLFLMASLISEIWYAKDVISTVKFVILQAFFLLLPMLAITGFLGLSLAKLRRGRLIDGKKIRMIWIILICVVILLPAAYQLNSLAEKGEFDFLYLNIQLIEYIFDLLALALLGLNFRDGVKLVDRGLQLLLTKCIN